VYDLVGKQDNKAEKVDLMLVVGGFNSSNTSHLQEIPEMKGVPSFWVNSAACIDTDANKITHKLAHGEVVESQPWLPEGPLTIGTLTCPDCTHCVVQSEGALHVHNAVTELHGGAFESGHVLQLHLPTSFLWMIEPLGIVRYCYSVL
jgi:hypothetical protein